MFAGGFVWSRLGGMTMINWLKRIATPAAEIALADSEKRAGAARNKVEHLAVHFVGPDFTRSTGGPSTASPATRVIAVCSQKGGVGKTTIAAHLAVQAAVMGHGPAVLVDTDPQGSLDAWWGARRDRGDRALPLSLVTRSNLAG